MTYSTVTHTTDYPMKDKPPLEQWWIGMKSWKRFSLSAKKRFAAFRRQRKPCRVIWFVNRVSPNVEEVKP